MTMRALLFLLAFTVEVTVHAARVSLPSIKMPVQEPTACVDQAGICAVKTPANAKYTLKFENAEVVMDASTTVIRESKDSLKLITGTVWVKNKNSFKVSTTFGEVISEGGEFWVKSDDSQTTAYAVESSLVLNAKDKRTALQLEAGEENWLGGINKSGLSTSGVPKAISFEDHVFRWARLYSGSKTNFESDVKSFHERWSRQLASVADYHKQLAENRLKVLDEEAAKRAQMKAQEEHHSRELRALFRKKQMLD